MKGLGVADASLDRQRMPSDLFSETRGSSPTARERLFGKSGDSQMTILDANEGDNENALLMNSVFDSPAPIEKKSNGTIANSEGKDLIDFSNTREEDADAPSPSSMDVSDLFNSPPPS